MVRIYDFGFTLKRPLRWALTAFLLSMSGFVQAQILEPDNGADQVILVGESISITTRQINNFSEYRFYFDDSGIAPIISSSNGPHTVTFNTLGTFTVVYERWSLGVRRSTYEMTVTVEPDLRIDSPQAGQVYEAGAAPGERVSLEATAILPPGEAPGFYTFEWFVIDIIPPNTANLSFPGEDPGEIDLPVAGLYRFLVQVTYPVPGGGTATYQISNPIDLYVSTRPTASIDQPLFNGGTPTVVTPNNTLDFQSSGVDADHLDSSVDDPALAYSWKMDGATADDDHEDPGLLTLSSFGSYRIQLEVTDTHGLVADPVDAVNNPLYRDIIVSYEPVGVIQTSLGSGPVININEQDPINLIAGGSSDQDNLSVPGQDPLEFTWSFSGPVAIDPITYDLPRDPLFGFVFPQPGSYTVTLNVTDSLGVVDQTPPSITVNVNDRPDASIVTPANDLLILPGASVNFDGNVVDTDAVTLTYAWDFGAAGTSNLLSPGAVTFPNAGIYDVVFTATDDQGAQSADATVRVTASTPPDSGITAPLNNQVVQVADFINFAGTGTDPDDAAPLNYSWRIVGPGGVDETVFLQNFSRQYGTSGIYTATLTTTDQYGVADATPAQVIFVVNNLPNGEIVSPAGDIVIGTGESVNFQGEATDADIGATFTYDWVLTGGNPGTSNVEDPGTVGYAANGGFTATFTVRDNFNTPDPTPSVRNIRVSDRPDGTITAPTDEVITVISGSTVAFSASAVDTDDNGSVTYEWDFGGAAVTQTGASVNTTFGNNGEFTMTMTARDGYGLGDNNPPTKTLRVTNAPDGAILAPTSDPSIAVALGDVLNFVGDFVDLDNNGPYSFRWTFDGLRGDSIAQSPGDLTFDSLGSYSIQFFVTDGYGVEDPEPATLLVNVTTRPEGTILTPVDEVVTIVTGDSVNFTGQVIDDDLSIPFTYAWDFDNGAAASTVLSPGNTAFSTPGVYAVEFLARDSFNIPDDTPATRTIRVTDRPLGTILAPSGDQVIGIGESLTFQGSGQDPDSDISPGLTYAWDFAGVAANSDQAEPGQIQFNTLGAFAVTFTVRDGFDVPDDTPEIVNVTVGQRPNATITVPAETETIINPGETIAFTGVVSDPDNSSPFSYDWDFSLDGVTSATATTDPIAFPDPGRFTVTLAVADSMTLEDLTPPSVTVVVNDPPEGTINRTVLGELLDNDGELIAGLGDQLTLQADAVDPNTVSGLPANTTFTYHWRLEINTIPPTVPEVIEFEVGAPGVLNLDRIGNYSLALTVSDDRGQPDLTPDTIVFRVNDDPDAVITQPELDLVVNPGESQFFAGQVSDTDGDNPVSAHWQFGIDGVPDSSDLEPGLITFPEPGQVTVSLTAIDALGLRTRRPATRLITINDPPAITQFAPAVEEGEVLAVEQGASVDFSATVTDENPLSGLPDEAPGSLLLNWNFGALGSSNQAQQTLAFPNRGVFPIIFSVTDSFGGTTTRSLSVASTTRPTGAIIAPDSDAPLVNLGDTLFFDADGDDQDLPGGESLRFVWDFDGEQVCPVPPCAEPGDVIEAQTPGLISFDDDRNVPLLQRNVTMLVYDNYGLPSANEQQVLVTINRPPSGLNLVVYTQPGSTGTGRARIADPDSVDFNTHTQELTSTPALGILTQGTDAEGYLYTLNNNAGNPASNDPDDYGAFPFGVTATDSNDAAFAGQGLAMILPEEFMAAMRDWPQDPITDCLQVGSADCADFERGREIDTMVEIINRPHLVKNQPPVVVDDYFNLPRISPELLDVLDNDFDGNLDTLEVQVPPVRSDAGVSLSLSANAIFYDNRDFVGFDHFTYSVQEILPGGIDGALVSGDAYVAVNLPTAPSTCDNANLLSWVPGVTEDLSVSVNNTGFANQVTPSCKAEFDGAEVWWAIHIPDNVPAVSFVVDTVPTNTNGAVGDTVMQIYRVLNPGRLGAMCSDRSTIDCVDNISGANLYSRFTFANAQDFAGQVLLFMVDAVDNEQGTVFLNLRTAATP